MPGSFMHSLYFKMATGLASILIIVGVCYTLIAGYMAHRINQSGYQQVNQNLALNLVSDNKIVHDGEIDDQAMKMTFMQYMTINPSIEIYYLNLNGKILSYSAEPGKVKREYVDLDPIRLSLNNKSQSTFMGDDPRSLEVRKPFSVTPIPDKHNPEGYLYVMLQSEALSQALDEESQQFTLYLGGIVLFCSLLIGLTIGLYLFYRISRRLKRLQQNVADFVENDFFTEAFQQRGVIATEKGDEINDLERHVSLMVSHIQQQLSALKQQDNLRREMVANISHDLRTPLASLQGFLETLTVKFKDISDKEKKQFIDIAVKQTKGLHKLIDSLFELAKLDAQEHPLKLETFPLLELIYDVAAKFQYQLDKKSIQLKVLSDPVNPAVYADIGLIERVLDNLINNAIYYSHSQGQITITIVTAKESSLIVKVSDQGRGIADDQKALVFERFHQAHTPERKDGHAGLGLCIVKKIIELHQQKIWVESQLNKGSQFNFTLTNAVTNHCNKVIQM